MRTIPTVAAEVWRLAKPYFTDPAERRSARLLLAAVILMRLVLVAMEVVLSYWNSDFFTSLQDKDWGSFSGLLLTWNVTGSGYVMPGFCWIAAAYITIAVYRGYLTQWLQIRWRWWMTQCFLNNWLADKAYWRISLASSSAEWGGVGVENPDQRIAEDLRDFVGDDIGGTRGVLSFGVDLISTLVSLCSFVVILWQLSGPVTIGGMLIHGYMVWAALLYAIVGTAATHAIARPLAALNFTKQRTEADFRFALTRLRENAEGVALLDGEEVEKRGLMTRFDALATNWMQLMHRYKLLTALTSGYGQVASVFPIVVAAPRYFAGQVPLGILMQTAGAFGSVQGALSWFVDTYADLASFQATVERLGTFRRAVETAREVAGGETSGEGLRLRSGSAAEYILRGATITRPEGPPMLRCDELCLRPGETWLVTGRSGTGKSTLLRALAGLWPFGSGEVARPMERAMFLPQRPYIPLGTLRHAVCYPAPAELHQDDAVAQVLRLVGLGGFLARLDQEDNWPARLSGGEQQRLAVARALLARPAWLFLDEATASLDAEAGEALYEMLRQHLQGTTVVSVAHQPTIAQFHARRIQLRQEGDGPAMLQEVVATPA